MPNIFKIFRNKDIRTRVMNAVMGAIDAAEKDYEAAIKKADDELEARIEATRKEHEIAKTKMVDEAVARVLGTLKK